MELIFKNKHAHDLKWILGRYILIFIEYETLVVALVFQKNLSDLLVIDPNVRS